MKFESILNRPQCFPTAEEHENSIAEEKLRITFRSFVSLVILDEQPAQRVLIGFDNERKTQLPTPSALCALFVESREAERDDSSFRTFLCASESLGGFAGVRNPCVRFEERSSSGLRTEVGKTAPKGVTARTWSDTTCPSCRCRGVLFQESRRASVENFSESSNEHQPVNLVSSLVFQCCVGQRWQRPLRQKRTHTVQG